MSNPLQKNECQAHGPGWRTEVMPNQFSAKTQFRWLIQAVKSHNSDECLLWPFGTGAGGYGRLQHNGHKDLAHRVAFQIAYGHWPTPYCLHTCDNPLCVNPRHLRAGTQLENMRDRISKGRPSGSRAHLRGSGNNNAKLTDRQVVEIRENVARGVLQKEQAAKFLVSPSAICNIVKRKRWAHI